MAPSPPKAVVDAIESKGIIPHHWHVAHQFIWECDAHSQTDNVVLRVVAISGNRYSVSVFTQTDTLLVE